MLVILQVQYILATCNIHAWFNPQTAARRPELLRTELLDVARPSQVGVDAIPLLITRPSLWLKSEVCWNKS